MKNLYPILLLLTVILTLSCCKDKPEPPCDDNGLPCLTQEGKNTYGCRVNGSIFIPEVDISIGGSPKLSPTYNESTKRFILAARRDDSNDFIEKISFMVYIENGVSSYEMDVTGTSQYGYTYIGSDECEYYHNLDNKGTVNITFFDETQRIVAGTFSMTLINNDCTESTTMNITDGRFDIRF